MCLTSLFCGEQGVDEWVGVQEWGGWRWWEGFVKGSLVKIELQRCGGRLWGEREMERERDLRHWLRWFVSELHRRRRERSCRCPVLNRWVFSHAWRLFTGIRVTDLYANNIDIILMYLMPKKYVYTCISFFFKDCPLSKSTHLSRDAYNYIYTLFYFSGNYGSFISFHTIIFLFYAKNIERCQISIEGCVYLCVSTHLYFSGNYGSFLKFYIIS